MVFCKAHQQRGVEEFVRILRSLVFSLRQHRINRRSKHREITFHFQHLNSSHKNFLHRRPNKKINHHGCFNKLIPCYVNKSFCIKNYKIFEEKIFQRMDSLLCLNLYFLEVQKLFTLKKWY